MRGTHAENRIEQREGHSREASVLASPLIGPVERHVLSGHEPDIHEGLREALTSGPSLQLRRAGVAARGPHSVGQVWVDILRKQDPSCRQLDHADRHPSRRLGKPHTGPCRRRIPSRAVVDTDDLVHRRHACSVLKAAVVHVGAWLGACRAHSDGTCAIDLSERFERSGLEPLRRRRIPWRGGDDDERPDHLGREQAVFTAQQQHLFHALDRLPRGDGISICGTHKRQAESSGNVQKQIATSVPSTCQGRPRK